uniref:Uncharacterized protein n=1 Tax=Oryza meridionalis TaxID=40149 RepID=A0A0E0FEC1_9ORYZ
MNQKEVDQVRIPSPPLLCSPDGDGDGDRRRDSSWRRKERSGGDRDGRFSFFYAATGKYLHRPINPPISTSQKKPSPNPPLPHGKIPAHIVKSRSAPSLSLQTATGRHRRPSPPAPPAAPPARSRPASRVGGGGGDGAASAVFYTEKYHPIQAGSINSTDVAPHDNAPSSCSPPSATTLPVSSASPSPHRHALCIATAPLHAIRPSAIGASGHQEASSSSKQRKTQGVESGKCAVLHVEEKEVMVQLNRDSVQRMKSGSKGKINSMLGKLQLKQFICNVTIYFFGYVMDFGSSSSAWCT